jgi:hypothetical protein
MLLASVQKRIADLTERQASLKHVKSSMKRYVRSPASRQVMLFVFATLMLFGSYVISNTNLPTVSAANPGAGNACSWYRVRWGDTLVRIAASHSSSSGTLAQVNAIRNRNLIIAGQSLCIPYRAGNLAVNTNAWRGASGGAMLSNGTVRWYDYSALQWSTRPQVATLLRHAAAHFGLPANLVLAIAWQESGWYQHVIAWDGGIGVMQLMPYTAQSINASTGIRRNPYVLMDNIYLGVTYLSWLWHSFHGNLARTISGYNEGGWSVIHRGIFNWRYVNSVLALKRRF